MKQLKRFKRTTKLFETIIIIASQITDFEHYKLQLQGSTLDT